MTELSPDARALLDAARDGDNPSDADRSRVRAAVLAQIAAGGAVLSSGEAAAAVKSAGAAKVAGASGGLALKVLVSAVVLSGVIGGGYALLRGGDTPAEEPKPAAMAPRAAATETPPAPTPTPTQPAVTATSPAAADDVRATPAPEPAPLVKPRTPKRRTRAITKPRVVHKPRPATKASQPGVSPATSLLEEKQLIARANAALRSGDAGGALRILGEHAKKFPRGMLSANRSGARVLALCELGRAASARREATKFLARWSKHPMAERVRRACADGSN